MTYEIKRNTTIEGNGDFALRILSGNVSFAEALAVLGPTTLANLIVNGTLSVTGASTLSGGIDSGLLINSGNLAVLLGNLQVVAGDVIVDAGNVTMVGASASLDVQGATSKIMLGALGDSASATQNGRAWKPVPTISLINDALSFSNSTTFVPIAFGSGAQIFNTANSPFTLETTDLAVEISENGDYLFDFMIQVDGSSFTGSTTTDAIISEGPLGGPWVPVSRRLTTWGARGSSAPRFYQNARYGVTVTGAPRSFRIEQNISAGTGTAFVFADSASFNIEGPR